MPIPESYIRLVECLAERTAAGQVNWKSTPDEKTFLVYFKDFALSAYYDFDPADEEWFVRLEILNDQGKEIDSFWVTQPDKDYDKLWNLYSGARRKALRIDEALSSMLDELDRPWDVGKDPPDPDLPF